MSKTLRAIVLVLLFAVIGCNTTRPSPSTPSLDILYNVEEESTEKSAVAQVLQAQLMKSGITIHLQPVTNSIFYQRIGSGDFQAASALWYLDYNDPEGFLTDFFSKSSFRMSGYESNDYDRTYLAGLLAPSLNQEREEFDQAQQILQQDLPWIPLYSNNELFLLRQQMSGFSSNAYQYYDYRRVELSDLRVASNVELQTFDPAQVYDLASKHVATQCYEGLVAMGPDLKVIPSLAESWQLSPSGDRLTFTVRKGVRFQGGFGALSARDVKASFERMLRVNSPYAYIFNYVVGVDDFRNGKAKDVSGFLVEGPLRFSILLKRPLATMVTWLMAPAAFILPAQLPPKYDFSQGSVGTGPFVLTAWDGSVARFKANDGYWGRTEQGEHLPKPKTLSIRIMKDVNTELTAFQKGDLDILNVPLALYNEVLDSNGKLRPKYSEYQLREVPLNNLKFVAFRMGKAPWGTDVELRRKVNSAVDRAVIVASLFRGHARPATTIIPPGMNIK